MRKGILMKDKSENITHNNEARKQVDMPFWFMQITMVTGLIFMSSFVGIILLFIANVSGFLYIISLGKFVKEIGKNPTQWTITTLLLSLLLGPVPIWITYILTFDMIKKELPQSAGNS
jgi:hypothetical protein